jgi:DNA-binding ferritin-like protein
LGEDVQGSGTFIAKTSTITDFPFKDTAGRFLCDHLKTRLKTLSNATSKLFIDATEEDDHVTANILIGYAQELDKLIWKLTASLQ